MAWYNPDSFHITVGSVETGSIADTYTDDSVRHVLDEDNATPAMDYEYWFESIPGAINYVQLHVNGYYEGNPAHIVDIEVWNFLTSAWEIVDTMLNEAGDLDYTSPLLACSTYTNSGQLKVRFVHPAPGNTSHDLHLDEIRLSDETQPTTTVPTTTLTTEPPTTAAPTTAPPTTAVPTTLLSTPVPTTTLTTIVPTTLVPTTAPPTPPPIVIDPDPIEITLSFYSVLHYNPPAAINPALDQAAEFDPIEITLSVEGGEIADRSIALTPILLEIRIEDGGIDIGKVITSGALELCTVITAGGTVVLQLPRCNIVKWGKIGYFNFDIDESNIAGERPMDWDGCIYHIRKLGDKVVVYGENGVSIMKASGVHWGMDTIQRIGLKNKGAFAGSDAQHFFVNVLSELFQLDNSLVKLDYSEFIASMGTVILSLNTEKNLLHICDGTTGYIYSPESKSFGEGPPNITGLGAKDSLLYVASAGEIVTPKFDICTDTYDFGTRKPKTIQAVEIGTDVTDFLYVSVDYRMSYKDEFKQIGWFLVNPEGKAWPKCYGVDFRFRVRSTVYEYLEIDYMKVRGHIHGFSWSDTQRVEGY